MINYREILRLNALGYSQRSIATGAKASRNTVKDVLEKESEKNITWSLDEDITNADLEDILSDKQTTTTIPYAVINYEYIHKELSKKGVTLTLLWQEYCERAYANGQKPYMRTQFGDKYRRWARVTKATMRITHKPGEAMQVDWAGGTIPYFDPITGRGIQGLPLCCCASVQLLYLC